jgi:hypothetical protein
MHIGADLSRRCPRFPRLPNRDGDGSIVAVAGAVRTDSEPATANITGPPLVAGDLTLRQPEEADVQAVAVAASTAWATLPTWVISIVRGLACSATGIVMVRTPSW